MTSVDQALPPHAIWHQNGNDLILEVAGNWRRDGSSVVVTGAVPERLADRYEIKDLGTYDSTLPAFLLAHFRRIAAAGTATETTVPPLDGLPDNLRGLLELALAVPEEDDSSKASRPASEIRKLGKLSLQVWAGVLALMDFTGQAVLSLGRLVTGRARFRSADFWMTLQECGLEALPIVSLISSLIGLILAFVGNVQLANFGANLFVADLVGIAMVREMGVVMTAIIMSGRTGAAFAAHLGSMKANEEIDALRTFGFDPFDFLVLPRMLALVVMI